jgi:hypothetical protein
MFENEIINGVHASRYIASWCKAGGHLGRRERGRFDFKDWLESLGLTEDEVRHIYNLATNGKLELENSAREFIEALDD